MGYREEPPRLVRPAGSAWEHEIRVALPLSARTDGISRPVLWVLDGSAEFEVAVSTAWLTAIGTPERQPIVVGVGTPLDQIADYARRRQFDFVSTMRLDFDGFGGDLLRRDLPAGDLETGGGAEAFRDFLVGDLRRRVAAAYAVTDDHILAGASLGGAFTAFVMLSDPGAFSTYVCMSPPLTVGDSEIFRREERHAASHDDLAVSLYLSAGADEILERGPIAAWGIVSSTCRFAEILCERRYPSLDLHVQIFPHADHTSAGLPALAWALRERQKTRA